jgi:Ca2+-binding EF-hand superfamily protein
MTRLPTATLLLLIAAPAFAQDAPRAMPSSQTKAEAEERVQMVFEQLDANHDGFITQDEVDAFTRMMGDNPRITGRVVRMFGESDANHDGKVSAAEAKTRADAAFDAADSNHDGTLSPEERMAAKARSAASPQQ